MKISVALLSVLFFFKAAHAKEAPPPAPFTDYRFEEPGQKHKILAKDLPPPAPRSPWSRTGSPPRP